MFPKVIHDSPAGELLDLTFTSFDQFWEYGINEAAVVCRVHRNKQLIYEKKKGWEHLT